MSSIEAQRRAHLESKAVAALRARLARQEYMPVLEVAHRLSSTVRDSDLVARFGGDEFVILVQPLSHDPQIACRELDELMERLQQALNQPYSLLGPQSQPLQHHSSASLGSIMFHDRHLSAEELIRRADIAMYRAKEAGRNQTVRFDPSMRVELERAVQLENTLCQVDTDESNFGHGCSFLL